MADFDITREVVQRTVVAGNRTDASFSPAAGHNVAIVYIEAGSNGAAILAKLAEIEALSDAYGKKIWLAEALSEKNPRVDIRVIVHDDIEA